MSEMPAWALPPGVQPPTTSQPTQSPVWALPPGRQSSPAGLEPQSVYQWDTQGASRPPSISGGTRTFPQATEPAPQDMYQWWQATNPSQEMPEDPRRLLQIWYEQNPQGFAAYNSWMERNYGGPSARVSPRDNLAYFTEVPEPPSGIEQGLRAAAQGLTFGHWDDIVGRVTNDPSKAEYERQNLDMFRMQNPTAAAAWELAGGVPWAYLGGRVASIPGSVVGRSIAGAGEGAAAGFAYGMGNAEGDYWSRVPQAIPSTLIGGAGGAAIPYITGAGRIAWRPAATASREASLARSLSVPERADLGPQPMTRVNNEFESAGAARESFEEQARLLYQQSEDFGVNVLAPSAGATTLRWNADRNGLDPLLHERASIALGHIENRLNSGQPMTLAQLDDMRKVIVRELQSVRNANDANMLSLIRQDYDDYLRSLTVDDIAFSGIDPQQAVRLLEEARSNWSIASRFAVLEEAETRARLSGVYEEGLQREIRRIIRNPNLRSNFTRDELELMYGVANGDQSAWRRLVGALGGFAPKGWTANIPVAAALAAQNPLPLAVPAIGAAARNATTNAIGQDYQRLINAIAGGGQRTMLPMSDPVEEMLQQLNVTYGPRLASPQEQPAYQR